MDELGIEPGPALRELHQAILHQDPELDLKAPESRAAETGDSAFVGRARELAELVAGLDSAFAGRGRLFLLEGEPASARAGSPRSSPRTHARGACVLVGRCWEAGGAPAYWPWIQSLRAYIRDSDAAALHAQLGAGARELAQLVPDLRQRFPDLPPPSRSSPRERVSACLRRSPSFCATPASSARSCSSSTTCTRPMRLRCCCCATSRASSTLLACC